MANTAVVDEKVAEPTPTLYPYPSREECEKGWRDTEFEAERRKQADIADRNWRDEYPYEDMLQQLRQQMLTTKGRWKISASSNNTKQMDALFRHANQLHSYHLIGIKWRDQAPFPDHITLEILPDMELKRKSSRTELTPSHNRLIIQKPCTDEIMVAEFDENDNTWHFGAPEPSLIRKRIKIQNQELLDAMMVGPGSFKPFSEHVVPPPVTWPSK